MVLIRGRRLVDAEGVNPQMPRLGLEPQMPQQRLAIRSHSDGLVITDDLLAAPWRSPDVGHCLEAVPVMVLE